MSRKYPTDTPLAVIAGYERTQRSERQHPFDTTPRSPYQKGAVVNAQGVVVVDDVEHAEDAPISERVRDEVHAPALVRPGRRV